MLDALYAIAVIVLGAMYVFGRHARGDQGKELLGIAAEFNRRCAAQASAEAARTYAKELFRDRNRPRLFGMRKGLYEKRYQIVAAWLRAQARVTTAEFVACALFFKYAPAAVQQLSVPGSDGKRMTAFHKMSVCSIHKLPFNEWLSGALPTTRAFLRQAGTGEHDEPAAHLRVIRSGMAARTTAYETCGSNPAALSRWETR